MIQMTLIGVFVAQGFIEVSVVGEYVHCHYLHVDRHADIPSLKRGCARSLVLIVPTKCSPHSVEMDQTRDHHQYMKNLV